MAIYNGLRMGERLTVMPERLCELAEVKPSELLGRVVATVWAQQSAESAIAASILHPQVIRRTAKAANSLKFGGRDRELFFRVTGTLPDKKGTTIVNNPQTVVSMPAVGPTSSQTLFTTPENRVIEMDRLLEAGEPEPEIVDV